MRLNTRTSREYNIRVPFAHTHMEKLTHSQAGTVTHTWPQFASSFFLRCALCSCRKGTNVKLFSCLIRFKTAELCYASPRYSPTPLSFLFLSLSLSPGNFRLCVKRTHPHPPTHPQLGQRVGDVLQMTGSYGLLQTRSQCQSLSSQVAKCSSTAPHLLLPQLRLAEWMISLS